MMLSCQELAIMAVCGFVLFSCVGTAHASYGKYTRYWTNYNYNPYNQRNKYNRYWWDSTKFYNDTEGENQTKTDYAEYQQYKREQYYAEMERLYGPDWNMTNYTDAMNYTDPMNATNYTEPKISGNYKKRYFIYDGNAGCNKYNGYSLEIQQVTLLCGLDEEQLTEMYIMDLMGYNEYMNEYYQGIYEQRQQYAQWKAEEYGEEEAVDDDGGNNRDRSSYNWYNRYRSSGNDDGNDDATDDTSSGYQQNQNFYDYRDYEYSGRECDEEPNNEDEDEDANGNNRYYNRNGYNNNYRNGYSNYRNNNNNNNNDNEDEDDDDGCVTYRMNNYQYKRYGGYNYGYSGNNWRNRNKENNRYYAENRNQYQQQYYNDKYGVEYPVENMTFIERMNYVESGYLGHGLCETGSNMTIRARFYTKKGFPRQFNITPKICRNRGGHCSYFGETIVVDDVCEFLVKEELEDDDVAEDYRVEGALDDCPEAGTYLMHFNFSFDNWRDEDYAYVENFTKFTIRFQIKPTMNQTEWYEYMMRAQAIRNGEIYYEYGEDYPEEEQEQGQDEDEGEQKYFYWQNPYTIWREQNADDDNPYRDTEEKTGKKTGWSWWSYWHAWIGNSRQKEDDPTALYAYETLYCHIPMKVVNDDFNISKYYQRHAWRNQRNGQYSDWKYEKKREYYYTQEQYRQEAQQAAQAAAALGVVGLMSMCCYSARRRAVACSGEDSTMCGCTVDESYYIEEEDEIVEDEESMESGYTSVDGTRVMLPPRVH